MLYILKMEVGSIITRKKRLGGRGCLMSSQWCWTCYIFQLTCFSCEGSILVKLCLFFFLIGSNWSLKVHYTVPGNILSNTIHLSHSECWHNFTGQGTPECLAVIIFGSNFIHHGWDIYSFESLLSDASTLTQILKNGFESKWINIGIQTKHYRLNLMSPLIMLQ